MSALTAKRAELAGQPQAAQKHIDQLRADLVHVDAVLRMFDRVAQPDAIPAGRPYRRPDGPAMVNFPGVSLMPYEPVRRL